MKPTIHITANPKDQASEIKITRKNAANINYRQKHEPEELAEKVKSFQERYKVKEAIITITDNKEGKQLKKLLKPSSTKKTKEPTT